jgi:hypothetical protein
MEGTGSNATSRLRRGAQGWHAAHRHAAMQVNNIKLLISI